jgi:hypothetical protein
LPHPDKSGFAMTEKEMSLREGGGADERRRRSNPGY